MLTEKTYLRMKGLIAKHEAEQLNNNITEQPYLEVMVIEKKYNPKFGDDRICKCGHSYYRHFDSYDEMEVVGCKYCDCYYFEEETKT